MKKTSLFLALLFSTNFASAQICKLANKIPLPGDGGWDYITVDEAANTIYTSHGNIVQIINAVDGKLIATIENLNGVH